VIQSDMTGVGGMKTLRKAVMDIGQTADVQGTALAIDLSVVRRSLQTHPSLPEAPHISSPVSESGPISTPTFGAEAGWPQRTHMVGSTIMSPLIKQSRLRPRKLQHAAK